MTQRCFKKQPCWAVTLSFRVGLESNSSDYSHSVPGPGVSMFKYFTSFIFKKFFRLKKKCCKWENQTLRDKMDKKSMLLFSSPYFSSFQKLIECCLEVKKSGRPQCVGAVSPTEPRRPWPAWGGVGKDRGQQLRLLNTWLFWRIVSPNITDELKVRRNLTSQTQPQKIIQKLTLW